MASHMRKQFDARSAARRPSRPSSAAHGGKREGSDVPWWERLHGGGCPTSAARRRGPPPSQPAPVGVRMSETEPAATGSVQRDQAAPQPRPQQPAPQQPQRQNLAEEFLRTQAQASAQAAASSAYPSYGSRPPSAHQRSSRPPSARRSSDLQEDSFIFDDEGEGEDLDAAFFGVDSDDEQPQRAGSRRPSHRQRPDSGHRSRDKWQTTADIYSRPPRAARPSSAPGGKRATEIYLMRIQESQARYNANVGPPTSVVR